MDAIERFTNCHTKLSNLAIVPNRGKLVWGLFTAAMLEVWNNETVLHENRSYFPEERKCIVSALQHGGNDVTWKCSILVQSPKSQKVSQFKTRVNVQFVQIMIILIIKAHIKKYVSHITFICILFVFLSQKRECATPSINTSLSAVPAASCALHALVYSPYRTSSQTL